MTKNDIADDTGGSRPVSTHHPLEVGKEGLIHGYKLVNVAEEGFSFIWRYNSGAFSAGKETQWIRIILKVLERQAMALLSPNKVDMILQHRCIPFSTSEVYEHMTSPSRPIH
jgi:hypothetical protein